MARKSLKQVQREIESNEPRIRANQVWYAGIKSKPARKIRILAQYPKPTPFREEGRAWIYVELPGGILKTEIGRLGICPEFNLRYVFRLEGVFNAS